MILALAGALALQTTLAGLTMRRNRRQPGPGGGGLRRAGFRAGDRFAGGSAGGIVQDALAGGIVGIGGLSKTLVGFMVGVLGAQFIVSQPLPRFVMFVGATVVHELCFQALYALVETRAFALRYSAVLTQAAVNGIVGILAFQIVEWPPAAAAAPRPRRSITRRRLGRRLTTND